MMLCDAAPERLCELGRGGLYAGDGRETRASPDRSEDGRATSPSKRPSQLFDARRRFNGERGGCIARYWRSGVLGPGGTRVRFSG